MAVCEVCGNDYERAFEVKIAGRSHVFDSFECAIHALAPHCAHCGCRVIGHGLEKGKGKDIYCCASCMEHGAHTSATEPLDSTADA
jgi:hypothetical protein